MPGPRLHPSLACPRVLAAALAALAALAGCAAPAGEDVSTDQAPLTVTPITPIRGPLLPVAKIAPSPYVYSAGPRQTVKMTPHAGYGCVLTSVSGYFTWQARPSVEIVDDGTTQWLVTGDDAEVTASCVSWGWFSGSGVSANVTSLLGTKPANAEANISPSSPSVNLTEHAMVGGFSAACFLAGLDGDWLVGDREQAGVYGRVNAGWVGLSGATQIVAAETNGAELSVSGNCFAFANGRAFTQQFVSSTGHVTPLPARGAAICGLTGLSGGLDDYSDGAQIQTSADGTQSLVIDGNTTYATATCLPYAQ